MTNPPQELASAIQSASRRYNVSPTVLTGIWRIESGSSFPNPYVNSSGYGGLFGTSNWNASTQAQANTAAQILSQNIQSHGGNLGAALLAYSGGGYSSVPGQTGGGGSGSLYQNVSRPSGNAQLDLSVSGALGAVEGFIPGVSQLPIIGGLVNGVSDVKDAVQVFVWLLSPKHWAMIAEAVVGVVLMLLGIKYLATGSTSSDIKLKDLAVWRDRAEPSDREYRSAHDQGRKQGRLAGARREGRRSEARVGSAARTVASEPEVLFA